MFRPSLIGEGLSEFVQEEEIQTASEVGIARPGIVVNMPILSWPGGHR